MNKKRLLFNIGDARPPGLSFHTAASPFVDQYLAFIGRQESQQQIQDSGFPFPRMTRYAEKIPRPYFQIQVVEDGLAAKGKMDLFKLDGSDRAGLAAGLFMCSPVSLRTGLLSPVSEVAFPVSARLWIVNE